MRYVSRVTAACLLCVAGVGTTARAADVDAELRALYVQGNALYEAGRDGDAEVVFEQAWALRRTYDVAISLGQAEANQKKWLEAVGHLRFAQDNMPAGITRKKRTQIAEAYAKVLTQVALVVVRVEPNDAKVEVDGAATVPLPEGLAVEPGARRITLTKAGFERRAIDVTVSAGERKEVAVTLAAEAIAPPAGPAPAAPGTAPVTPPSAPRGVSPSERSWVLPAVATGAGVVLLGAAVGFTVASNDAADMADEEQARLRAGRVVCSAGAEACAALQGHVDDRDSTHTAAAWLYVGGSVAVAAAVALVLWPEDTTTSGATASTRVVPMAGPERAGVAWMGRF